MRDSSYFDQTEIQNVLALFDHHLNSQFKQKLFQKNEFIYQPESKNDCIYFIKKGRVKVGSQFDYDKKIIKDILKEGEFFGNISPIGLSSNLGFAMAMEETELLIVPSTKMEILMQSYPELTYLMMKSLSQRLIQMEQRVEAIVFKDSRSRIIDFIKSFVKKYGKRVGYEIVIWKVLTHQEIANFTATSRQTVTTVLNELRNKNILTFNRRRLLIRDYDLLDQEAA